MPFFCRSGHPVVRVLALDDWTGSLRVAEAKKSTAGGLPLAWFSGLAILVDMVEATAVWPQGSMDAYITMIPKVDGDSTPLGQRPLSVLHVVYRLWASLRLSHLKDWVLGWVPQSVFSLGNGCRQFRRGFPLHWISWKSCLWPEVISCMSWLLMLSSLLARLTGLF